MMPTKWKAASRRGFNRRPVSHSKPTKTSRPPSRPGQGKRLISPICAERIAPRKSTRSRPRRAAWSTTAAMPTGPATWTGPPPIHSPMRQRHQGQRLDGARHAPRAAAMCSGADSRTCPMRMPSGPSPGRRLGARHGAHVDGGCAARRISKVTGCPAEPSKARISSLTLEIGGAVNRHDPVGRPAGRRSAPVSPRRPPRYARPTSSAISDPSHEENRCEQKVHQRAGYQDQGALPGLAPCRIRAATRSRRTRRPGARSRPAAGH